MNQDWSVLAANHTVRQKGCTNFLLFYHSVSIYSEVSSDCSSGVQCSGKECSLPCLNNEGNVFMLVIGSTLVIDRHVIAGISVVGTICDVMGGLYLAYDLLGGNNGPLCTLTRVVTYTLFFCL